MDKDSKLDIVLSVLLIAASAVLNWIVIPSQISVPPMIKSSYLSPAFVPRVFTLFIGFMSLFLLCSAITRKKRYSPEKESATIEMTAKTKMVVKEQVLVIILWLFCCLFVFAVEYLGIIISSILLLTILMFWFGQKKWILIGSIGVIVPFVLYLFFHGLAKVSFPKGILLGLEYFL